ncbi:hypothetical protein BH09ACT12_BH09ACT12_05350 [soil metagenome]
MSKLSMAVAGGIGFLLGSRAGRAPYETAVAQVQKLREDPRVRQGVSDAKSTITDKVSDVAQTAATKVDEVGSGPGMATP